MGNMTVRSIPEGVHDYLRDRAKSNGRSLEAEVRAILVNAYVCSQTGGFGQRLRQRFVESGVLGDELSTNGSSDEGA